MTYPTAAPNPPFAGPEGLWTADPVELAARLFTAVFVGQGAVPLPQKDVAEVYSTLASLGWVLPERTSGSGPVAQTITMLRFGPGVLTSADPVAALKARLH